jgi:nitroreductase
MNAMPTDASAPAAPSMASAFQLLIQNRRSVYSYLQTPVPRTVLESAFAAAVLAPNHHRTRPWRFFVFADEGRAPLAKAYEAAAVRLGRVVPRAVQRAYDAPTMVVIACVPDTSNPRMVRAEEEFATAAATQILMLALTSMGLATLLTTGDLAESPEVLDLVGLTAAAGRLMAVLNVGYRDPERPFLSRPAPDMDSVVSWRMAA